MLTRISQTIDCSCKTGQTYPPIDKVVGGEFPYLHGQVSNKYEVQSNTKLTMQMLSFSVRNGKVGEASRSVETTPGTYSAGEWKAFIGSTQMTEYRYQSIGGILVQGADEQVSPFINSSQSPSMGEGVIVPSGTAFQIRVTPAQNTNILWHVTIFGKRGTTTDIQTANFLTATTTANQVILSYTPSADWTIITMNVSAEVIGSLIGQLTLQYNGMQIIETPYLGCGESTSTMFHNESYAGIGCGALNIPLWGIEFYPHETIEMTPIAFFGDGAVWGLTIAGTESTLGTGSTGATSFAY